METIRHRVGIETSPDTVLARLTTVDGLATWWTRDVSGDAEVGGKIQFRFGGPDRSVTMEVEQVTDRSVVWRCIAGPDEWVGGRVTFDVEDNGDETVLKFTQAWREPVEFMFHCSTKWGFFLLSLKAAIEDGAGTPFPGELQISSWG
jgi:uncharacterized protein YndB with AHSA1/START domain